MAKPHQHTWIVALALALAFIVVYGHVRGYEIQSGMAYNDIQPNEPAASLVPSVKSAGFLKYNYEPTNGVAVKSGVYSTK